MNKMKKNGAGGLFIFVLSFFLIGALFLIGVLGTAAEAVDVTINGPGFSTTPYQIDSSGLSIDSVTGSITLNIVDKLNSGEIHGNVDTLGSLVYLRPDGVTTGVAKYAAVDSLTGNYSFTNLPFGAYAVFPVLEGAKFTPVYRQITLDATTPKVDKADFGGGAAVSITYSIYGTVSGASGTVTLTLSGAASKQISTTGSYIFSRLEPGTYTVTPSAAGLNFTPSNSSVTIQSSDEKRDFTASIQTYKISGYVKNGATAISGAAISINTGTCSSSDVNGYYSCNNLPNGSYTLNASKSGYSITPAPAYVTISNADKTQDFTATPADTYTISGTVTGLAAGDNATISLSGAATQTTTTNGAYSFTGLLAGSYTVTPSKTGYTFTPTSSSFSLSSNTVKDFTATSTPTTPTVNATTLSSGKEVVVYDLAKGDTDLYKATVTVPSIASFVNATKDWSTRRDMLVMYGGASCTEAAPTIADHTAVMAGISNGSLTTKSDTGVTVNGRTFYYNFQDVNNQSVIIGRLFQPAAPAGCYYVLIYNVSTGPSDYSLTFSATPK